MKKLLILTLVFGMASLANADPTTLQISVGGDPEPVDSQIWLLPSEEIVLDIWTTDEIYSEGGLEGFWAIGVDTTYGTLSGGVSVYPDEPVTIFPGAASYLPPGEDGLFGGISTYLPQGSGLTGTIYDGIIFHCEALGDAVVNLYSLDFSATPYYDLIDSVVIHQIPEPMTVLLLGFGGLFLRRRR